MEIKTLLIVGGGAVNQSLESDTFWKIKRAPSCCEAADLLEQSSTADLVCTDIVLPDGNWCDVLRLVVEFRIEAEIRVLDGDDDPILRFEIRRDSAGSMQALGQALHESTVAAASLGGAE